MTTPRPDHQIIACTQCKAADGLSRPGQTLAHRLWAELDGQLGYEVRGVGCMAGCERPCTVAFRAPGKAQYLFGDIDPATDFADLLDFARMYHALADGWSKASQRPQGLWDKTLARIPAHL
jgi:predicted metal-binding protein